MIAAAGAPNDAQIDYWNSTVGETWAKWQHQLDRQIDPLGREALRVLAPRPGEHILDIGCGCGQTSLELAAAVSPAGSVVGVDISRPMLDVARARLRASPGTAGRVQTGRCPGRGARRSRVRRRIFAVRRHVLRRSRRRVRERPQGLETGRPSRVRLLAGARAEPLDARAARSGPAVPAAAGARRPRRSRPIRVRRRPAAAHHLGRCRIRRGARHAVRYAHRRRRSRGLAAACVPNRSARLGAARPSASVSTRSARRCARRLRHTSRRTAC